MAKHQVESGLEVTICTTNADYPSGTLRPPGTEKRCDDRLETHYFSVQFQPLGLSVGLARYLNDNIKHFDIVHIHGLYRLPSTFAGFLARKQSVPYIICPHGSLDPYLYHKSSVNLPLKRLYEHLLDIPNLQGAGAIHYTAEAERQLASFLDLRAPSFVVPNGIDWEPFEILPVRGGFRSTHGLGDAPLVLFLGRLHHVKGLDILIPAFEQVHREVPGARLAIVGPSNDGYGDLVRGWVRDRALADAVTFVEFLTGPAVVQAYVDADVFVLPSYTENFGVTVVEAMACATPVVVSDHVKVHFDVSRANAGIVTTQDRYAVAEGIITFLRDGILRDAFGNNGRIFAREHFAWRHIIERLNVVYKTVVSDRNNPQVQAPFDKQTSGS
ncbi:MAG: glycosyltransferase [Thiocapsa sp.]|nr:MAG: glycosyltransferase [Thiocapsa sp.]